MDVQKNKNVEWHGTCALLRDLSRNNSFIIKNYDAKNNKHAQILILCEALLRLKELDITSILCLDIRNKWQKLLNNKVTVHREIFLRFVILSTSLDNYRAPLGQGDT